jgi:hypothetical protein
MFGDNHGWTVMKGTLESNMGTNDMPVSPT